MTAHAMKGDRERCLDAGMDEYITKPLDSRLLCMLVERLAGLPTEPEAEASPLVVPTAGPRTRRRRSSIAGRDQPSVRRRCAEPPEADPCRHRRARWRRAPPGRPWIERRGRELRCRRCRERVPLDGRDRADERLREARSRMGRAQRRNSETALSAPRVRWCLCSVPSNNLGRCEQARPFARLDSRPPRKSVGPTRR